MIYFFRTQIQKNAAIRGFSTSSSLLYTHTKTKANYYSKTTTTTSMFNDDMNLFNVNILPLFNTIKVFLTNFIKSNYTAACDNQNNNKSIDFNNTAYYIANGCVQSTIMPHNISNVTNIVLHPINSIYNNKNNKFHMDECSYIQFNCMTKTFSCINTGTTKTTTKSPKSSTISTTDNILHLDEKIIAMKTEIFTPLHCYDNNNETTKDIDYLKTKSTTTKTKTSPQKQPPQAHRAKLNSPSPNIPEDNNMKALKSVVTADTNGSSNGGGGSSNGKSQHHRRKNRSKNRKLSSNNEVNNNTTTMAQQQQKQLVAEPKTNKKYNKNRKRNTCTKSKVESSTPPTTTTTKLNISDKNKNKKNCISVPTNKTMCITSEKTMVHHDSKKPTAFTNVNTLLHQSNSDDNCFYTATTTKTGMFINSFECDKPLANSNSRQRHISDSSDDFICFELSDNEIEPQMIYTDSSSSDNCISKWWENKCDSGKRWNSTTTDDQDFDDNESEKNYGKKKVIFKKSCKYVIFSALFRH